MLTYSYLVISFLFDKSKGSVNHLIKHVQQILIEHLNQHTFVLACYRYNPDVTIFHERGFFTQAFLSMDVALATPWRQLVCSVTRNQSNFPWQRDEIVINVIKGSWRDFDSYLSASYQKVSAFLLSSVDARKA